MGGHQATAADRKERGRMMRFGGPAVVGGLGLLGGLA
jgi:hypothetical protein